MTTPVNGQAWWVRFLLQAPGFAFAAFLIWWLTSTLDARLAELRTDHENQLKIAADTAYVVMSIEKLVELTRQTCINTGKTDAEKGLCK